MPTGIPKAGFRRSKKYWGKLASEKSFIDIESDLRLKAPRILAELENLTKPIECPNCGNKINVIDKDVGMYLVDHAIGKAKQRQEIDITQTIQLNADQIDHLLESRFGITIEDVRQVIAQRALPEGEAKAIE